jgi:hypothetical protein
MGPAPRGDWGWAGAETVEAYAVGYEEGQRVWRRRALILAWICVACVVVAVAAVARAVRA